MNWASALDRHDRKNTVTFADEPDPLRFSVGRILERFRRLVVGLVGPVCLIPSVTHALAFQLDFRNSTYQVQPTDTFASLLAQHQSETLITTNTLNALQGISAPIYAGGVNQNYSILMTINLNVLIAGT